MNKETQKQKLQRKIILSFTVICIFTFIFWAIGDIIIQTGGQFGEIEEDDTEVTLGVSDVNTDENENITVNEIESNTPESIPTEIYKVDKPVQHEHLQTHEVSNEPITVSTTVYSDAEHFPSVREVNILMYHHLLKAEENKLFKENGAVISVERFEEQMKFLHDNNFKALTLREMHQFLNQEITLPEKSVLITFDDGYLSNYTYAYPILKKYGFKAAVFIVTANVAESPQPFDADKLIRFSWEEIEQSSDVFEFASHTHAMHSKDKEVAYLICKTEEEIKKDLKQSVELLNTQYFAYPYGAYNSTTINILKDLGFEMAFTTKPGKVTQDSNPYELNRYAVWPNTSLEKFKQMVGVAE